MYKVQRRGTDILEELEKKNMIPHVFLTSAWIQFLVVNQGAEPVVLELSDNGQVNAYFVGLITRKLGVKILGSPFEGWLTPKMGFIRVETIDINRALRTVGNYATKNLGCLYAQISDYAIKTEDLAPDIKYETARDLCMSLEGEEETLLHSFSKKTRKDIRLFTNRGAEIRQVTFDEKFVDDFYAQLTEVFAKQNLKPAYSKQKIMQLCEAMRHCPERVLALQVFAPEGNCIASSLTFGYGQWCCSMATASSKSGLHYMPNEAIRWETIKYWKSKGVTQYDLCGYREYKLKFNPQLIEYPVVVFERVKGLLFAKKTAKKLFQFLRKIKGKV